MSMGFPPFSRAVKMLVIGNAGMFLLVLMLNAVAPQIGGLIATGFSLIPFAVVHGWVWQLVTYSFLHGGLFHLLFNMLALWMFGSQLESDWGFRQFLEFYFFCVVGAALITVGVAYGVFLFRPGFMGISPLTATVGSSGGIYGLLIAFGILYGDREMMMFPLPFLIKAKYVIGILLFIAMAGALQSASAPGQSVAYFAHLGGAFFGWLYLKFLPRQGLGFAASEKYYGLRNSYYKWKRRRAARKFEVYMRKHDRKDYFDEYGNYREPKPGDKKDSGSKSPWVN
jgi:membrane associated rhomboid family serine protease